MSASKPAIGQPAEDPVRAALAAAPRGDSSLLTPADRERIEANRRAGKRGVPHAEVMAKLEERRRRGA
jgi:hypothetical protein